MGNCKGIIVPNKIEKINKKPVNGRIHYLDAKKNFLELKNAPKKLPVLGSLASIPTKGKEEQHKREFCFYDTSTLMQGLEAWMSKLPEIKIYTILIDNLRNLYNKIKEDYPRKKVLLVFDIASKNDLFYLFLNNFKQLRNILKDVLNRGRFFDLFVFASVNKKLIPVLEFDEKFGTLLPILPMMNRLESFIDSTDLADEIDGAPAISDRETEENQENIVPNKSIASKLVDALQDPSSLLKKTPKNEFVAHMAPSTLPPKTKELTVSAKADEEDPSKIKVELDGKTLSKVMRYFKVTNPDIIANVKAAIDTYIKETGAVPTKANAESLVLKAVNRSIHGTDTIDEAYLANPNLLFEKLKDVNVFSVPLEFPKNQKEFPFDISDIVTLKAVTGQHRQKYEFVDLIHENIEKVFKTLEDQTHPIKVNKINYEYVDNNLDRFIEYTISLQNMTGNKQKYDVKLDIPTVLNDKYFKLGGNR